jgi:cell wall-associated NlpC family hydrolase
MSACRSALSRAIHPVLALFIAVAALVGVQAAPASTPSAHASVLTLGRRAVLVASWQRGKPYRYGAAGPRAFDCSGLVKYTYARLGHYLPHNSYLQYLRTRHLTHAQMRPGDLIFMNVNGGGIRGIDHVGIYAGHGYWWVARHTGTVITKQRLWTSRYWVGRVRA